MAKTLHPDVGGAPSAFADLTEVYGRLTASQRTQSSSTLPAAGDFFDPLVVNPNRGFFDLYLKVWPILAIAAAVALGIGQVDRPATGADSASAGGTPALSDVNPSVGECVQVMGSTIVTMSVVDCSSSAAEYEVARIATELTCDASDDVVTEQSTRNGISYGWITYYCLREVERLATAPTVRPTPVYASPASPSETALPSAPDTTPRRPSPVPSASTVQPTASAPPSNDFNDEELQVLAMVPETMRDSCRRTPRAEVARAATASIMCTPGGRNGVDKVWYESFGSHADMVAYYLSATGVSDTDTECPAVVPSEKEWSYSGETSTAGRVACEVVGGQAQMVWTENELRVVSTALQSQPDWATFYRWWRLRAGPNPAF